MPASAPPNLDYARSLIDFYVRNGLEHAVITPGSRSTPLTIAAARHPDLHTSVHFDERGAAFHALGIARATGRVALLICTSGTAAANYYPAVIEASMDHVPLLVLTADRPGRLVGSGANQTIFQDGLFGRYPRYAHTLPEPGSPDAESIWEATLQKSMDHLQGGAAGPVHLNIPFDEPLLAPRSKEVSAEHIKRSPILSGVNFAVAEEKHPAVQWQELLSRNSGLIIAGRNFSLEDSRAILDLAHHLGWPVIADVLSQLRFDSDPMVLRLADLMTLGKSGLGHPELILHFGGTLVSKRLNTWIEETNFQTYVQVHPFPDRQDPANRVTHRIQDSAGAACAEIKTRIPERQTDPDPLHLLQMAHQLEADVSHWLKGTGLNGLRVTDLLCRQFPHDHLLFLSNSLPIREFDWVGPASGSITEIFANRGASGIDGIIATACGVIRGKREPGILVTGDLAFLHDLNSLALVQDLPSLLHILLLNNGAGGIFDHLPIAAEEDVFSEYFTLDHNREFCRVCD